jgi:hypothetical protein
MDFSEEGTALVFRVKNKVVEATTSIIYIVCPGSVRTVSIKYTGHELFSKFHSFYSK